MSVAYFLSNSTMQRFFPDFDSLNRFTSSLDALGDRVQCPHCSKGCQLVSHGVVYKQRSIRQREPVGKRIFCSNRYQHRGCGRTIQLYIAQVIPALRYSTSAVFRFLSSLLKGLTLEEAYSLATGQTDSRHAWRWLRKLEHNLTDFRCVLRNGLKTVWGSSRSRRMKLLLPTIQTLLAQQARCPCAQYQLQQQRVFM